VACSRFAIILVDLAYYAHRSRWTAAAKVHHTVVASAAILAGIRCTVIDVHTTSSSADHAPAIGTALQTIQITATELLLLCGMPHRLNVGGRGG